MKLLFLDVDGVLTTTMSPFEMVPECVGRLADVVERTGCDLVISSTWRFEGIGPTSDLQKQLRQALITLDGGAARFERLAARIVGETPDLPEGIRQDEILSYISRVGACTFAAVDDWLPDFDDPPPDWLVVTDANWGLMDEGVEQLVALLSKRSPS